MPLYNVEIQMKVIAVVEGDDADDARHWAQYDAREILRDAYASNPTADVRGEVTKLEHLRDGWDGDCLPYGKASNKTIAEILKD